MKKTFKVYHTKNWALNANLHSANLDEYKPKESDYELVAYCECTLGETFHLTNHIDTAWWDNEGVTKVKESRSTSVGDVVEDCRTGKLWLVAGVGWCESSWGDGLSPDKIRIPMHIPIDEKPSEGFQI